VQATTGEGVISLTQFWKNFIVKQVIENICESWQEVTASTMRAMWKYLLPYCANDFCGFENRVGAVIEEVSTIGKALGFEDVDSPAVKECLDSHSEPLTDADLIELQKQRTYDERKLRL
jgi:hypothetical protein